MRTRGIIVAPARETVTDKTYQLVEAWLRCTEATRRLREEWNSAECAQRNAESALAKWLIPPDAQPAEKYNVWFGSQVVTVVVDESGRSGTVTIRTPKER